MVAAEGLAWTALGALAGTALGLLVSLVLVHVVNPQSFHWTMDLVLPWARLGALALAVVAGEGAAWTVIGAIAGLALGLAVAIVLVHVVNPQSFHWTMDLLVPWARLLALCAAVVTAGTLTAWLAGRAAAGRDAVLAVKEDW